MNIGLKRSLTVTGAIAGFILVLLVLFDESAEKPPVKSAPERAQGLPRVSYVEVEASDEQLLIPVFGELKPKWDVLIKSQVSGEVRYLGPRIEPGERVDADEQLAEIDKTGYRAQVDQAALALEQAKLTHLQAQKRTTLARSDWQRSGLVNSPSDLMLFKPQLAIAEQSVQSARSQLALAQKSLADTNIKAPFSGVIVERFFGKGQVVSAGEALFRLVDDQFLSLEVAVGEQQWSNLAPDWQGKTVALYSSQQALVGQAHLTRGGHVLDLQSRQFRLFLDIPPELRARARAGQFVQLNLPGRTLANVLNLPESALSQDGTVWFIEEGGTLREYTPAFYFRRDERVLVAPPVGHITTHNWRIAVHPLAYFLSGKRVAPFQSP